MIHVLVTSAGTASAINVIKALRLQREFELRIYAVDYDYTAPGLYLADKFELIPKSDSQNYIPAIIDFCSRMNISIIFPIHSCEIEVFAENQLAFEREGIQLFIPSITAIRKCNDKKLMCDLVRKIGILTPACYDLDDNLCKFPMIAKPNNRSGSRDQFKIKDPIDLAYVRQKYKEHLIQEWIDGTEITVDCLFGPESTLIVASPRLRIQVKAGQCVKGMTIRHDKIVELCLAIAKRINYSGPANLQFIINNNQPYFIEINPRFAAGGLMLTVNAGANIPWMILSWLINKNFGSYYEIQEGMIMLRYYEEVYLDKPDYVKK